MVYHWLISVLDRMYPATCLLCGAPGHGGLDLCPGCLCDLPHNSHPCRCCALPLARDAPYGSLCGHCQKTPPVFDQCQAALCYQGPLSYLVGGLKFHARLANGRLLAGLLGDYLERRQVVLPEVLLPVPLHPARLRQRGFNQALELTRPLGKRLHIPVDAWTSVRARATRPQSDLDKGERRRNVRGAFGLRGTLQARHVAVVDDVVTTGHTVSALVRLLKQQGVARVDVWAVARTPE